MKREPDLLAYTDFRNYLRDTYAFRKGRDRRYSYGVFAKRAGIASRGHLQSVLAGGLRLTPETLPKYRKGLGLTGAKGEYFSLLVALGQAADEGQREAAQAALRLWRKERTWKRLSAKEGWEIFARGPRLVVHCLRSFPGFREDPAWISRRLLGAVTPAQAREALDFLKGWKAPEKGITDDADGPDFTEPFRRHLLRSAARRANRRMGYGGRGNAALLPLTRKQAVELDLKIHEWVKAQIPEPSRGADTELCLVLTDVVALSAPV